MISLKKVLFISALLVSSITSIQAAPDPKTMCDASRKGVPFHNALIKPWQTEVVCVYSSEVMYEIEERGVKFNPILEQGSKWEHNNHSAHYCVAPNNPAACRFTKF